MACCPYHRNCCCKNCCRTSCNDCHIHAVNGCQGKCCEWYPIDEHDGDERALRACCDQNGCCGLFPEDCRNKFWPDFTHPRWLCCKDLYCARNACCKKR